MMADETTGTTPTTETNAATAPPPEPAKPEAKPVPKKGEAPMLSRLAAFAENQGEKLEAGGAVTATTPAQTATEEPEEETVAEGVAEEDPEQAQKFAALKKYAEELGVELEIDGDDDAGAAGGDEFSQLQTLAAKLGLAVEGNKVMHKERAEFRAYKRQEEAAIQNMRQQVESQLAESVRNHNNEIEFARQLRHAHEIGDVDAIAKAFGHEDWNKYNDWGLGVTTDPHYKQNRELRQWKEQQEQRERQYAQQQEQQQRQATERHYIEQYHRDLAQQMATAPDPFLKEFAQDASIREEIRRIQAEYWDGQGMPMSPRQAIRMKRPGADLSLYDHMVQMRERLNRAIAQAERPAEAPAPATATEERQAMPEPVASKPAAPAKKQGKRAAPETSALPPGSNGRASKAQGWKGPNDPAWRAHRRAVLGFGREE